MGGLRHLEEYLVLGGVTHKSALIAWGAFHLKARGRDGSYEVMEDDAVEKLNPPRRGQIGLGSDPYATRSVEIGIAEVDRKSGKRQTDFEWEAGDPRRNHYWVAGLDPDTEYEYAVKIDGELWAANPLDWNPLDGGGKGKKGTWSHGRQYDNRFMTLPHPDMQPSAPLRFLVIGDFGEGLDRNADHAQMARRLDEYVAEAARSDSPVRFVLTTGDNVYAHRHLIFGHDEGEEDDDWFYTFYHPYRYVMNRVAFFPAIGNHDNDSREVPWEGHDDRGQLYDNFYLATRLEGEAKAGRAVDGGPEASHSGLFYRFNVSAILELICLDTTKAKDPATGRKLLYVQHASKREFMRSAFGPSPVKWRIPFFHHPVYCSGPMHEDTEGLEQLPALFQNGGVKLALAGHEHNFQRFESHGVTYAISGAMAKVRVWKDAASHKSSGGGRPLNEIAEHHFLVVTATADQLTVEVIGKGGAPLLTFSLA